MRFTVEGLHRLYLSGEAKPSEIVRAALDRIENDNQHLNAYLTINREGAIDRATSMDAAIRNEISQRPLAGIPVAVKDNLCTEGVRTTCGSRTLEDYFPPYTATVVKRLEEAGAIIVGKTNLDEFAMGSS